jgi:hypothetical protein
LVDGLLQGAGTNFPGFAPWFRVRLGFEPDIDKPTAFDEASLRRALDDLVLHQCDLVLVVVQRRDEEAYRVCKSILLSNGIACQFVIASKLESPTQRPWILGNIALALYAKAGGTPWVVAEPATQRELVMGVSRAQDRDRRFVVGFVTLFNQDGEFLLMHSKTPVVRWEDYVSSLEDLIVEAYEEYAGLSGPPDSLVLHFHKRPGWEENSAVDRALVRLGDSTSYSLLHLNEFSPFRLFDTTHTTHVPPSGLAVDVGARRALLLLDGLEGGKRQRIGVPNIWDISMDARSTTPVAAFPRLVGQVHRFSKVNWRGFNARSIPVTVNYSKLICDQVLDIGLDSWNSLVAHGRLRDKAWFL